MRTVKVTEFGDWLSRVKPSEYIFASENHPESRIPEIGFTLRFGSAEVSDRTCRVLFRNGENSICIGRIKEVRIYDDRENVGTVFEIVCSGRSERIFRFIAD